MLGSAETVIKERQLMGLINKVYLHKPVNFAYLSVFSRLLLTNVTGQSFYPQNLNLSITLIWVCKTSSINLWMLL